jgi:predicted Zn finger-like uncharacterized protein
MRLSCPNCDAEYEVDDSAIPAEGRDVQCSNCATTWFQVSAVEQAKLDNDGFEHEPAEEGEDEEEDDFEPPEAAIQRSSVDPEALDVIHEEVARETQAREADLAGIETQTDLGLDNIGETVRESISEQASDTAEAVEDNFDDLDPAPQRDDPSTKRELLPDIEEINSTLAGTPDPVHEPELAETPVNLIARRRRGFRIGFGFMLLLSAILLAFYVNGSNIAERFPDYSEPLARYASFVDGIRVWLDRTAQTLVERLTAMIGQVSADEANN